MKGRDDRRKRENLRDNEIDIISLNLEEERRPRKAPSVKQGRKVPDEPKKKKTDKPLDPHSIEALLEENEQLRMENAYLKKLNALVQQRQDLESRKKSKS